jgi:hypothetical protein
MLFAAVSAVRRQRLLQLLQAVRQLKKEKATFSSQARRDTNEAALMVSYALVKHAAAFPTRAAALCFLMPSCCSSLPCLSV